MKALTRYWAILIVVIVIAVPLVAQTTSFVRARNTLNVRSGPGIEFDVITTIGRGAQYSVLDRSITGNWLLIDLGFAQGWVHKAYVNETNFDITALGQGGGFVVPQTTFGTGGTTFVPSTTFVTGTAALGQGGGFLPATTSTGIDLTQTQTQAEFNATIGSWVGLNMRRGAGFEHRVAAILPQGKRATPLARNFNGTWILVDYNGVQGWVYMPLVSAPPSIDLTALPVQ